MASDLGIHCLQRHLGLLWYVVSCIVPVIALLVSGLLWSDMKGGNVLFRNLPYVHVFLISTDGITF